MRGVVKEEAMGEIGGRVLLSATELMRFMGCAHATSLDLRYMHGEAIKPGDSSDDAKLLQKHGYAHEEAHVEHLKASKVEVVEMPRRDLAENARATRAVIAAGRKVIFQGAFLSGNWAAGPSSWSASRSRPNSARSATR